MISKEVIVKGAGLAGGLAAWQIANSGISVKLIEMRPLNPTPFDHTRKFGGLVCNNIFGALSSNRASILLHKKLRTFNSLIIKTADKFSVPVRNVYSKIGQNSVNHSLGNIIFFLKLIRINYEKLKNEN